MVEIITAQGIPADQYEEAFDVARNEILAYVAKSGGERPTSVVVTFDSDTDEYVCELKLKHPRIARLRRITGYCSEVANFNAAKTAELSDRKKHMKVAQAGE